MFMKLIFLLFPGFLFNLLIIAITELMDFAVVSVGVVVWIFCLCPINCHHADLFFYGSFAEEETPLKTAKVELPTSQIAGGVLPGSIGVGYPSQPTLGSMPPL